MNQNQICPILIFLFTLLNIQKSWSQETCFSGIIIDASSTEPIPMANIAVFSLPDTSLISGTTSLANGNFKICTPSNKDIILKVFFIGYQTYIYNPNNSSPKFSNLTFYLKPENHTIKSIDVVSEKMAVVNAPGKQILNISQSGLGEGSSAMDALEIFPSVQVDSEDKISVRGQGVTILIDGMRSGLSDDISQIPSSSIESIEVIKNPSARYDVKNGTTVINIKLKRTSKKGANSKLAGSWASNGYATSLNFNIRNKNYNFFGNGSQKERKYETLSVSNREIRTNETQPFQKNQGKQELTQPISYLRGGFTVHFNDKSRLTSESYSQWSSYDRFSNNHLQKSSPNHELLSYDKYSNTALFNQYLGNYTLKWIKEFDDRNNLLINGSLFKKNRDYNQDQNRFYFSPEGSERSIPKFDQTNRNEKQMETTIKADWEYFLSEQWQLETGIKLNRVYYSLDQYYQMRRDLEDSWEPDNRRCYIYKYSERSAAIYASLPFQIGKWSGNVGNRMEYLFLSPSIGGSSISASSHRWIWIPTFSLDYSKENNSFGFSFSRRIKPPSYKHLNPFNSSLNPEYIKEGNPYLKPETIWSGEIGHHYKHETFLFSQTFFYKFKDDIITRSYDIQDKDITYSTYDNLSRSYQSGLEIETTWRILKPIRLITNCTLFHHHLVLNQKREIRDIHENIFQGKINLNVKFHNTASMQLTGTYQSPENSASNYKFERYRIDLRMRKTFMKKKISVNLTISDLFNTLENHTLIDKRQEQFIDNYSKRNSQIFTLSLSYKFTKKS